MSLQSSARRSGPLVRLRHLRAGLVALCLAAVTAIGSSGPADAAPRAAHDHRAIVDVPGAAGLSEQGRQKALVAYWTPQRIAKALANEGETDGRSLPRVQQQVATAGPHSTAVGKLVFEHANGTPDACTGTVVNSESEVLVLTAAHCLHDGPGGSWTRNQVFYPGFHDGSAPYGAFTAWNIGTSSAWSTGTKPDYEHDYGMLVVNDNASGQTPLEAAGGYQMASDMRTGEQVSLIGYSGPPYDGNHQELCQDLVEPTVPPLNMWQVECPNMTPGSSGGPWLLDYDYDTGTGYIGGLNSINDTGDFMASPRFDSAMQAFYALMEQIGEARP